MELVEDVFRPFRLGRAVLKKCVAFDFDNGVDFGDDALLGPYSAQRVGCIEESGGSPIARSHQYDVVHEVMDATQQACTGWQT